jgi:hypothetical protein
LNQSHRHPAALQLHRHRDQRDLVILIARQNFRRPDRCDPHLDVQTRGVPGAGASA